MYLTKNVAVLLKITMSELIKKLPSQIKKNKIKTGLYLGLSAYWGIILAGTLINFN